MSRYRDRLAIIADILSVVSGNEGARKTRIMYQANLSYKLLVQYLNDVTEAGLVEFGTQDYCVLTPKGREFLEKFGAYRRSREKAEVHLNHVENERVTLEKMCASAEMLGDDARYAPSRKGTRKGARNGEA